MKFLGFFYRYSKLLAIISALALMALIALTAIAWSKPATIEQKNPLVSYYQDSKFDYLVTLTPSSIFTEDDAPNTNSYNYPQSIVKSMDFTFNHSPSSDKPVEYSVSMIMENPGIWKKVEQVLPPVSHEGDFSTNFTLDKVAYFNEFATIEETLGISSGRFLRILVSATVDQQTFNFTLPIDMGKDLIKVESDLVQRKLCGRGAFSYVVNLKPNPVFATSSLSSPQTPEITGNVVEPGGIIFTRMADTMDINYEYRYSDNTADSQAKTLTKLSLVLTAGNLWSHEISLMETVGDKNPSINFNIDLAYFIDLMSNIRSETGVTANNYNLMIKAETDLEADTNHGKISETYQHTLSGSINGGILTWEDKLTNQSKGSITETSVIANLATVVGINASSARWVFLALAALVLMCLSYFIFLYYKVRPSKTLENMVDSYHKKYSDRIVNAVNEFPIVENTIVSLGTMEELASVSDELAKPIVYLDTLGNGLPHAFYVLDGTTRYQFLLQ